MKTGIFVAASALALLQVAVAQPHRIHRHMHKRDVIVTQIDVVTVAAPNVIVYVDENGVPVTTVTEGLPAPTPVKEQPKVEVPEVKVVPTPAAAPIAPVAPAAAPSPSVAPAAAPPAAVPSPSPAPVVAAAPSPSPAAPATPATGSANSDPFPLGVTYSVLNSAGKCKSADEIKADVKTIEGAGYKALRLYGTECEGVKNVIAGSSADFKIFAGLYELANIQADAQRLIKQVGSNWNKISIVSVGNEVLHQGQGFTVPTWIQKANEAKGALKAAGYTGPVTVVEEAGALMANPDLCNVDSSYITVNNHVFFDGQVTPETAGSFGQTIIKQVEAKCSGKTVIVAEIGWPRAGAANSRSVPSPANQRTAIASIKAAFPKNCFLFSAFNEEWKVNVAGLDGVEKAWGIIPE